VGRPAEYVILAFFAFIGVVAITIAWLVIRSAVAAGVRDANRKR
jgi:hypothetical protein